MPIANGSFEIAGAAPGLAQGWVSTYVSSLEEWADFEQNPSDAFTLPHDSFDVGWTGVGDQALQHAFIGETIDTTAAVFNAGAGQSPFENFERGWKDAGVVFLATLGAVEAAQFDDAGSVETFGVGWGEIFFTLGPTTAAVFDAESREDFEDGWGTFSDDIADFTLVAALFEAQSVEDFEQTIAPATFTAALNNTMTLAASPGVALVEDDVVMVENVHGTLPSPLQPATPYFLDSVSGSSFKLLNHLGGTVIDITDEGTGTQRLVRDPARWWSRVMASV